MMMTTEITAPRRGGRACSRSCATGRPRRRAGELRAIRGHLRGLGAELVVVSTAGRVAISSR